MKKRLAAGLLSRIRALVLCLLVLALLLPASPALAAILRYDVYVNGVLDHSLQGYHQTVVYGNSGVENTYQVVAVDSAGNQSAPAIFTTCAASFC